MSGERPERPQEYEPVWHRIDQGASKRSMLKQRSMIYEAMVMLSLLCSQIDFGSGNWAWLRYYFYLAVVFHTFRAIETGWLASKQ